MAELQPKLAAYRRALAELLDALDRMHSEIPLSLNVENARTRGRYLIPLKKEIHPDDVAKKRKNVA